MHQPSMHTKSSIENYLRFGRGQSYIIINDKPEQKRATEKLSAECNKVWVEFLNAKLSHDEATEKVLRSQNELNQINITIENILRQIKDPRTGKLLHMAAVLIPLLRAARLSRNARNTIAAVGDILGDLLDISALYSPIQRARILLAERHEEFMFWLDEMNKRRRVKEGFFRRYNNMNCPIK